ncbi:MAG: PDZ domain-containing protein [Planctomycetota bacterium]
MRENEFENPVLGYMVIAAALVLGLMTASVLGSSPPAPATEASAISLASSSPGLGVKSEGLAVKRERRWILGVRAKPTFTGCVVTEVIRGSAAAKAGVSVGDRILCIGGRQVGWVDARRVDLGQAVDCSPTAATQLLAQKASTGRVVAIAVRLQTLEETLGH